MTNEYPPAEEYPPEMEETAAASSGGMSTITKVIIALSIVIILAALCVIGLVVTGRLGGGDEATPTATPVIVVPPDGGGGGTIIIPIIPIPTPKPGEPTLVANTDVNVRSGPGTNYPKIGSLRQGETAKVIGVSVDRQWWVIDYPQAYGGTGWVAAQFVTVTDADNVPVLPNPPPPAPTAESTPIVIADWRGEYYNNPNLQGDPTLVRNDADLNFNWGGQSPGEGIPATYWSSRWTMSRNLEAGTYRFTFNVDDGVRMWIDEFLVVDQWTNGPHNFSVDINLIRGAHSARIEYLQLEGDSYFQWSIATVDVYPDWKAEYFDNPDVREPPLVLRNDTEINFNWGTGSPAPGVPADNWSARWSRRTDVSQTGQYDLIVNVQGGVRVWIDGVLYIDDWTSAGYRTLTAQTQELAVGPHDFRVDYFKTTGSGQINGSLTASSQPKPPVAVINGPTKAAVGQAVNFTARNSTVAEGSHITTFAWNFADGAGASGVDVSHTYLQPGVYNVLLTVTDDKELSSTASHRIEIVATATPEPDVPPVPIISGPTSAKVGETVTFDASASIVANPIVNYDWNLGDGSQAQGVQIQHIYNNPGVYNIVLVETDSKGLQGSGTHQINIISDQPTSTPVATDTPSPAATDTPPPVATDTPDVPGPTAVLSINPIQAEVGQDVQFDGSNSQSAVPIVSYLWDFGDGQTGNALAVTRVYNQAGIFNASLTVTDQNGKSDTATQQVQITAPAAPTDTPVPAATDTPVPDPGQDLIGINWQLTSSLTQTAAFDGSNISLNGGCNTFSGGYTTSGNSITISGLSGTQLICASDVMTAETNYITAVQSASSFQVDGAQLTLGSLIYNAAPGPR